MTIFFATVFPLLSVSLKYEFITSLFFSVGVPSLANVYLFSFISVFVPSSFVIFPTGTQTNWLPAVAVGFPSLSTVASSITIPLSTVVASPVTLNPAGITILFPFSSTISVFLSVLSGFSFFIACFTSCGK